MGYLEEFHAQIQNRDFNKFFQLWEEYCTCDVVDAEELLQLLGMLKKSELAKHFGPYVETALPTWEKIENPKDAYEVLKLLIDLETTNSPSLAEITYNTLKKHHGSDPLFEERIRLVGLRKKDKFQGAIANYDLLAHLQKGRAVFHTAGWGTGEIMDVSLVREQVILEFEWVSGRKDLSFANAFKTLIPLPDHHFLARRFANPDQLEKEAKENPVAVVQLLLKDLGPKTAAEIKDELCELVIPEKEWNKWWQGARAKVKKDTMIESPEGIKDPFRLRKKAVKHEERWQNAIDTQTGTNELLQTSYQFVRDFPNILKDQEVKKNLQAKVTGLLTKSDLLPEQELQAHLFLESFLGLTEHGKMAQALIVKSEQPFELIQKVDITPFKKRALMVVRQFRSDWSHIFLEMLAKTDQSPLREYLLKEICADAEAKTLLINLLEDLLHYPTKNPELFVWYFQKVVKKTEEIPFHDKEGQGRFLDSFLVLMHKLEGDPQNRELIRKMYNLISEKRYAVIRALIEGMSKEFVKEFLLLASKCQTFTEHDLKILASLASVVHPTLGASKQNKEAKHDPNVIWTTEEGYLQTQERIRQIGTTEVVENAREIEAARALGDLRENSEYKFALEKRARLQGELKHLSEQLNRARIITQEDVYLNQVGVGSIVELEDAEKNLISYTILGPWDANADTNILSFQSKFAEAMLGRKVGEKFEFRNQSFTVRAIKTIFQS
ncbi:GreA/GreB family elongation factor [Parachlamydia sp. AcF125]|uniref:GreA/GreB family elongation factor n=1 Tax=Parachlamydia sp. AcF125 TaxID=2795736 RepID=UPI001BC97057|nr:GreA/GreB family elongation factor [Parachlamydia sp. AcF125]MBS4168007.1 Transcription elongation factor GreA [Parachlamydia sp. AcF125]